MRTPHKNGPSTTERTRRWATKLQAEFPQQGLVPCALGTQAVVVVLVVGYTCILHSTNAHLELLQLLEKAGVKHGQLVPERLIFFACLFQSFPVVEYVAQIDRLDVQCIKNNVSLTGTIPGQCSGPAGPAGPW